MAYSSIVAVLLHLILVVCLCNGKGILYPRESESREVKSLDGIWNFRLAPKNDPKQGFREKWFSQSLEKTGEIQPMPVPSSYNDITQNVTIRDHIGWVWYDQEFYVPNRWHVDQKRIFVRFGSAHYYAYVWINGQSVVKHEGGHLPFVADVTEFLSYTTLNRITVAINNTLTPSTIPQGHIIYHNDTSRYPPGYFEQTYNFDFFNFAGIHRPVYLYTTPSTYIDDITVTTDVVDKDGRIKYKVDCSSADEHGISETPSLHVSVFDANKSEVATAKHVCGTLGEINITDVHLWWPYQMSHEAGYLYTMKVTLTTSKTKDVYRLPVGIRTLLWNSTSFMINGKPFYFYGFGRHEDYHTRGKGVDNVLIVKDYNLLKWVGANSYRTSHYPYAEEILDQADRQGIVIINESPGIGLDGFGEKLLNKHLSIMEEMVQRDKNRPSVVLWSLGNEPQSQKNASAHYFREVALHTKHLDPTRPVTLVINQHYDTDKAAQFMDIIGINRYFSWYSDTGHSELIQRQTINDVAHWYNKFKRPIIMTEYGAGTVAGMHMNPSFVWTEDYQLTLLIENFKAFATLRKNQPGFIGEMIWNFADFATPQEIIRPWGCMKGVFTRDRQPKAAAHLVRWHYWTLANETYGTHLPGGLHSYQYMMNVMN